MVFYVLTDVAGRHWLCSDGSWAEIKRGAGPAGSSVHWFRTKTEANKRRELLKKRNCHTTVLRCNTVSTVIKAKAPRKQKN